MKLLENNMDKISWEDLCCNSSEHAIQLLTENQAKIRWNSLSENNSAGELLKKNQNKQIWYWLSLNPSIFVYDYEQMRENCLLFKEDLMKERFHPRNLLKFRSWGIDGYDSDDDDFDAI